MHRPVAPDQPAKLRYLSGDYIVEKPGSFVLCAVTGERIGLDMLRYWNADLQEAYVSSEVATERAEALRAKAKK